MSTVQAEWTGSYPTLCYGEWKLVVDGKDVSDLIPLRRRNTNMFTFGTYARWFFNDDYSEDWEYYNDGLVCDEWISENQEWLDKITTNRNTQCAIFEAIQHKDWRHDSCGGCI